MSDANLVLYDLMATMKSRIESDPYLADVATLLFYFALSGLILG